MGSSSCGLEWKLGYCRNETSDEDEDVVRQGGGRRWKVEEEVVTKSQVGSGWGLHDRTGDEGVRLAWSPVITFCPISPLPLLDLPPPPPTLWLIVALAHAPLSCRHHLRVVRSIPTDSILARCYRAITDPLTRRVARRDATFENLLLEITAPERGYVSRAPWQIGICADPRNDSTANLGFRHECNINVHTGKIAFVDSRGLTGEVIGVKFNWVIKMAEFVWICALRVFKWKYNRKYRYIKISKINSINCTIIIISFNTAKPHSPCFLTRRSSEENNSHNTIKHPLW